MDKIVRVIFVVIFVIALAEKGESQRLYLHIDGGAMNYGGDLQDKLFTLSQANAVIGGGLYYKLSDHIALEGSLVTGKLASSDAKSNTESYRRNLSFYSTITEASLLVRVNLWDVPGDKRFTPYATMGIGFFHFNPYAYSPAGVKTFLRPLRTEGQGLPQYPDREIYKLNEFCIPFGGGITYAISDHVMMGAELNFRKTFTDYIDDVSSKRYADTAVIRAIRGDLAAKMSFRSDETDNPYTFNDRITRGNPDKKDVYYTCVIKLYVSLDGLFSPGNNSETRSIRKQTNCPKVL